MAWLMVQLDVPASKALAYIKHWRPTADPNLGFASELAAFDGSEAFQTFRASIAENGLSPARTREDIEWFSREKEGASAEGEGGIRNTARL
jgi:hypothetical protein